MFAVVSRLNQFIRVKQPPKQNKQIRELDFLDRKKNHGLRVTEAPQLIKFSNESESQFRMGVWEAPIIVPKKIHGFSFRTLKFGIVVNEDLLNSNHYSGGD